MKIRKGFTLIELLIVIVIIGIISSGMLISGGFFTDSARASALIADMQGLRTACTMLFTDNMDTYVTGAGSTVTVKQLAPYMSNPAHLGTPPEYTDSKFSVTVASDGKWYVGYTFNAQDTQGLKDKLAGRAKEAGLYASASYQGSNFTGAAAETAVYMTAR